MERLSNKKFQMASAEAVATTVAEIKAICEKYNFWDREASPYSFRMTVRELVESKGWTDFSQYTYDSKQIIISEINGFMDILEHWVEYQNQEDVKICYLQGKKIGQTELVKKSFAELLVETKMAELA